MIHENAFESVFCACLNVFIGNSLALRDVAVIELIYKSQNAPVRYPTMLHSEQKCAHSVLNAALWDMEHVYSGIYELGQF